MILFAVIKCYRRWFGLLMLAVFLSACQTPKKLVGVGAERWLSNPAVFKDGYQMHSQLSNWRYSAKIGVVTPEESSQANMVWQFDDSAETNNVVRLFGPLGVGAIKIEFDERGVQLSDKKGILHQGDSAEALLHRIVGWPIPVDALQYWLFSLPQPDQAFEYRLNEQEQLKVLRQFGWVINYSTYRDYHKKGQLLARKIVAKKQVSSEQEVSVTLVTKTWK